MLLSLVVGICSGLAAVLLEWVIDLLGTFFKNDISGTSFDWQYLILPGVGMLVSLFMLKFLVKDNIGHGVTKVLQAISSHDSRIKPHNMWSSLLTSSVTIGFGGSVGAEAPIVYTGAALGSNLGRACGLSYNYATILLGCGAAGAVAGIFKAPLAGVLFTVEILYFSVTTVSILPLLISTVSSALVAYIFQGQEPTFLCTLTPFSMGNIPFYIVMGVLCGFASLYFTNTTLWLEDKLGKISNRYLKWGICAVGLGLLIFLFPPLFGQGYGSLQMLLTGEDLALQGRSVLSWLLDSPWGVAVFFALVFFMKVFAMTLTNAGGGVGGTFGPTLFVGAIAGFVIARVINLTFAGLGVSVPEQNFALVGMAALMAGVMQAPMTAIFLIAEISGGYQLFIPLILTSAITFGTVRIFERYSIYTKRIAQNGELLTHDNDQAVLTLLKTSDLVRDKYPHIRLDATLREIVGIVTESTAAVFPVLDDEGRFQGLIEMDTIRKYLLNPELYDRLQARNLMSDPLDYVHIDEKLDSVLDKFGKTEVWRLPVVEGDGRYVGFISKSRILSAYRDELRKITFGDD